MCSVLHYYQDSGIDALKCFEYFIIRILYEYVN